MINPESSASQVQIGPEDFVILDVGNGLELKVCVNLNVLCAIKQRVGWDLVDALQGLSQESLESLSIGQLLARAISVLNPESLRIIWHCVLMEYQPDLSLEAAGKLVNIGSIGVIKSKLAEVMSPFFPALETWVKSIVQAVERIGASTIDTSKPGESPS